MSKPRKRDYLVNTSVVSPAEGRRAPPQTHSSLLDILGMLFRCASYWMCQRRVIRWLVAFSVFMFGCLKKEGMKLNG